MKTFIKLLVPLTVILCLLGCDNKSTDAVMKSNNGNAIETHFYNEFLACNAGPDYSEANLKKEIAEFNTLNLSDEIYWIGGYAPVEGKNTNSNGWWEIQWSSEEASQIGWQEWRADEKAQAWNEGFKAVLDCDETTIFGYETQIPVPESMALKSWDRFVAAEIACTFNDGKTAKNLETVVKEFTQWVEDNGTGEEFSFGVYIPVAEDQADFWWFNWHADFDSMARGNANWEANGKEMAARLEETATCMDPNLYNGAEFYSTD
tara:strand:- start:311 stop:1096 length:786 start_codon:yes stop_codon:yes gene_type:complete